VIGKLTKITIENADRLHVVGKLEGHTAPILSIDIAPGGQFLASGSMDGTARIWNLLTQEQVSVLTGNPDEEKIPRVAFSPTHPNQLATAIGRKPDWATPSIHSYVASLKKDIWSFSTEKPVWRLWNLETESVIHTETVMYALWGTAGLTYSCDGHWMAAQGRMFDSTSNPYARAAQLTEHHVGDIAFSDDSQLLALVTYYEKMPESIMYHFVEIYRVGSWQKVAEVKETRRISDFSAVRFLPNSHELLVRTRRDTLRGGDSHELYHFKGDKFEAITRVLSDVACFACHPDAGMVAVARYDGRMVLLNWNRQRPVATVQAYKPAKRVKMPRGIVIETRTTNIVNDVLKSHYRASADMVFSPDGKLLISADGDLVIRLWGVTA